MLRPAASARRRLLRYFFATSSAAGAGASFTTKGRFTWSLSTRTRTLFAISSVRTSPCTPEIANNVRVRVLKDQVNRPFVVKEAPAPAAEDVAKKRSEEHTSELQSRPHLVCRLLLEKKKKQIDMSM